MAINYATNALLDKLRTIGAIPSTNSNFTDQKLVTIVNDELQSTVVPLIMMAKQEYYVAYTDYTIESTTTPTIFQIPYDAIYNKLADITLAKTSNGVTTEVSIPNISRETITANDSFYVQNIFGFLLRDGNVVFYPGQYVNTSEQFLRVYYYKRPLELVTTANAGKITSINGNDVRLSLIPASWRVGDQINSVSQLPSFKVTSNASTIVSISNPIITVSDSSGMSVGDWVSLDGYCPIPQVPVEAMNFLISCAVLRVHEAMADEKMIELSSLKKKELGAILQTSITPRTDGARQVIQNRYAISKRRYW